MNDLISRQAAIKLAIDLDCESRGIIKESKCREIEDRYNMIPSAQIQRLTVDGVTLYRCDPAKNTACSKTCCFADGGQCYLTKHKDFEKTEESAG